MTYKGATCTNGGNSQTHILDRNEDGGGIDKLLGVKIEWCGQIQEIFRM